MTFGEALQRLRCDMGYSEEYVVRRLGAGASPARLIDIEAGREDADAREIEVFSELYGVSESVLWAGELSGSEAEPLRLLFQRRPGLPLEERTRAAIGRAARVARDYVELAEMLGEPNPYAKLRQQYRHEGEYGEPWRRGEGLALMVRDHLALGDRPVQRLRNVATEQLGILLIEADLRCTDIAACSFSSEATGPTVVFNAGGKNASPWRWRFTLAHELCHVLFDELSQTALGSMTRYEDHDADGGDEVEQRANSFAITLLAPKQSARGVLMGARSNSAGLGGELRELMEHFGINYKAARYRALHLDWASREEVAAVTGVDTRESETWRSAEDDWLDVHFPCRSVPNERRGQFARRVVTAFRGEVISRNTMVSLLEAAPDDDLDQLVQFVSELEP